MGHGGTIVEMSPRAKGKEILNPIVYQKRNDLDM